MTVLISRRRERPAAGSASEAGTALLMQGADFILKELQPGLPKPMKQAFEVPEQVIKSKGLKLLVPQKGFGGSGEILVPLT